MQSRGCQTSNFEIDHPGTPAPVGGSRTSTCVSGGLFFYLEVAMSLPNVFHLVWNRKVRNLSINDRLKFYDDIIEMVKNTVWPSDYNHDKSAALQIIENLKNEIVEGRR
jgi:hypothetical protein